MADLKLINVSPPSNGMNTAAPPGRVPEGQAPLVRNFLVHVPGKAPVRGPVGSPSGEQIAVDTALGSSFQILTGAWQFNNKVLLGFTELTGGAIPPWVAPYYKATSAGELDTANTNLVLVDLTAKTATKIAAGDAKYAPCLTGARLEKYVYGYAYYDSSTEEINGGYQRKRKLLRWDGTATKPTPYENAPFNCQAVKAHLNRLFCLGGTYATPIKGEIQTLLEWGEPGEWAVITYDNVFWENAKVGDTITGTKIKGGTTIKAKAYDEISGYIIYLSQAAEGLEETNFTATVTPKGETTGNTLFFSDQGGPVSDVANSWKDDVSGLLNQIVVGDDDGNDYGVGLAVVNRSLVIFKRHSVWALYGYSPSTFDLRNLTQERGCVDPQSILEVDGGVYFASQQGLEFFNGSEFTRVDLDIEPTVKPRITEHAGERTQRTPTSDFGRIQGGYLGADYAMYTFHGNNPGTGALAGKSWCGYFHIPTGRWAEFTSSVLSASNLPQWIGNNQGIPWIWDGSKITRVPYLVDPDSAVAAGLSTRDYQGNGTVLQQIPCLFKTDRIPLASPGYKSQGHRLLVDTKFPNQVNDASAAAGFKVKVLDADGMALTLEKEGSKATQHTTLGMGDTATNFQFGRRTTFDCFDECTDLQIQVEASSTGEGQATKLAEVLDITLEVQVSRQRRSV